jgi:hypothetical protein
MLTNTLVFWSTGAEAERNDIPSAVPVEDVAPETQEAADGGGRRGSRHDVWMRGGRHATRTRSGGGRPLAGDPRRKTNLLDANDRSRYE